MHATPGGKWGLFQNTGFVLLAFLFYFFTIKCLNGSLKDNGFVYSRAERGFKIVSSSIPFNQHRNQLTVYTYTLSVLIFFQSWSRLLSNGEPDSSSSALHGNLHPSAVKLEFDPKSLTSIQHPCELGAWALVWAWGEKTAPVSLETSSLSF